MPSASVGPSVASSGIGPREALFDSNFGAPRCKTTASSCNTGSLVVGRGAMNKGIEPTYPNT